MSDTMRLYKIAEGVTFIKGPAYNYKPSEITEELRKKSEEMFSIIYDEAVEKFGRPTSHNDEEFNTYLIKETAKRDPLDFGYYSDYKNHDLFEIYSSKHYSHYRIKNGYNRSKRISKYNRLAKKYFANYIQDSGDAGIYYETDSRKFLILDEILYCQGWFFTDKFFKSENTLYYAFDKKSAKRVLNQVIKRGDVNGAEAYDLFMTEINKFADDEHFILCIAW